MLLIGQVTFKKALSAGIAAVNLKDIEAHERAGFRVPGVYWTLGQYDNVVLFKAPDEKAAMQMALKRMDRMEIEFPRRRSGGRLEAVRVGLTRSPLQSAPGRGAVRTA